MNAIELQNISIKYGDFSAVQNLSFSIPKGEVFGFIGPNGAGKSSTIKVLATLLRPSGGLAKICGLSVSQQSDLVRYKIGYLPDSFGVYKNLSTHEYLHFFASCYRRHRKSFDERDKIIDDVLELTDLQEKKHSLVDALSRGMKQRLGVARVLLHEPDVLLLDEPASGLDPRARIEIREILNELKNLGKTILISSHILYELSQLCTRMGIIEQGRLVAEGTMEDLCRKLAEKPIAKVKITNRNEELIAKFRKIQGVDSFSEGDDYLNFQIDENVIPLEELLNEIIALGGRVRHFQAEELDIEEIFMRLTKGKLQ